MYTGEVRVEEKHLKDLMKTAETLQVRGLMEGEARVKTTSKNVSDHQER